MKIVLRLEQDWSEKVQNKSKTNCDRCGAPLWVAPHGVKYCNEVHMPLTKGVEQSKK